MDDEKKLTPVQRHFVAFLAACKIVVTVLGLYLLGELLCGHLGDLRATQTEVARPESSGQ